MKRMYFLLFFLAILAFSCSKDSLPDGSFSPYLSGQKTIKAASGAIVTLSPSEDGDDTDELLAAFEDAKAMGSGSTVQLAAGEYHIGFILVEEFIGSFTGAGMGKTILMPLPDLPYQDLYNDGLAPELVKFLRGNVRISNMSFLNLEGEPCPGDDLWDFLGIHDWAYTELSDLPADHKIKAVVDNVEFISHPDQVPSGWTPYTVQTAVYWGGDFCWGNNLPYSTVDITITNCTVREMNWAFANMGIEKGSMVISNNGPISTPGGILLSDDLGGSTLISGNEFYTPAWGSSINILDALYLPYDLFEFKLSDGCQYEISGNVFHAQDSWGAIAIANDRKGADPPIIDNKNPVLVLIKSNLFDLQGDVWAGIWNWITDDAVVRNNKFTGQAKTGIYVDSRTTNSLMLDNNFSNLVCTELELDWLPDFGEGYKILLCGNNNTVVGGGNNSTTVLDLGENNKITGAKFANEGEDPLGQTIADNYRIWKENLVKMRKR